MKVCGYVASVFIRTILHLICKVDKKELKKIPQNGPFIVAINHINFLEVPLIYVDLLPRKIHGIAKKETWDNPLLAFVANCWDSVSIDRSGSSLSTFRKIRKLINDEKIILMAPEGTRSGDGKLQQAKPGMITMAIASQVPIIPVAHYGGEKFWDSFFNLRRTRFTYKVGKPLLIKKEKINRQNRTEIIDQVMLRLAELLPEQYRGYYSDLSKIDGTYIKEIEFKDI